MSQIIFKLLNGKTLLYDQLHDLEYLFLSLERGLTYLIRNMARKI